MRVDPLPAAGSRVRTCFLASRVGTEFFLKKLLSFAP